MFVFLLCKTLYKVTKFRYIGFKKWFPVYSWMFFPLLHYSTPSPESSTEVLIIHNCGSYILHKGERNLSVINKGV